MLETLSLLAQKVQKRVEKKSDYIEKLLKPIQDKYFDNWEDSKSDDKLNPKSVFEKYDIFDLSVFNKKSNNICNY